MRKENERVRGAIAKESRTLLADSVRGEFGHRGSCLPLPRPAQQSGDMDSGDGYIQ